MSFSIPSGVFQQHYDVVDELINNVYTSTNCEVNYPRIQTYCTNCYFDSVSGNSSGKYRTGGPIPFSHGICPYCHNKGLIDEHEKEEIRMRVYWTAKDWKRITNIVIPDASIMCIGFATDLPKLKRADYVLLHKDESIDEIYKFVLAGQPHPHGFKKDRYFWTFMKQIS